MRWTEIGSILIGLAIGIFGWIIIIGSLISLNEGEVEGGIAMHLSLALLVGVVPVGIGCLLVWLPFKNRGRRRKEALERKLLGLAAEAGGILTPSHVARETELTLSEAKATLDELVLGGYCVSDLRDDGQVVYRFSVGS